MSPTSIFITGVTGYVGGDVLFALTQSHPDWSLSALVRSEASAAKVQSSYPNVRVVHGDLTDHDMLFREASTANVTIHIADSDHLSAVRALATGVASVSSTSQPRYFIHCSGTGNLASWFTHPSSPTVTRPLGSAPTPDCTWDDMKDVDRIRALPTDVFHHNVDSFIFELAAQNPSLRTAIVCPPSIFGAGRGPMNKRNNLMAGSNGLPELMRRRGKGFVIGEGKAAWRIVHVSDLADVFVRLAEAAVGVATYAGKATWGVEGFYFAENGEVAWGPAAAQMARRMFEVGLLPTASMQVLDGVKEARQELGPLAGIYGANAIGKASRARQLLGWKPQVSDFEKEVDEFMKELIQEWTQSTV